MAEKKKHILLFIICYMWSWFGFMCWFICVKWCKLSPMWKERYDVNTYDFF